MPARSRDGVRRRCSTGGSGRGVRGLPVIYNVAQLYLGDPASTGCESEWASVSCQLRADQCVKGREGTVSLASPFHNNGAFLRGFLSHTGWAPAPRSVTGRRGLLRKSPLDRPQSHMTSIVLVCVSGVEGTSGASSRGGMPAIVCSVCIISSISAGVFFVNDPSVKKAPARCFTCGLRSR